MDKDTKGDVSFSKNVIFIDMKSHLPISRFLENEKGLQMLDFARYLCKIISGCSALFVFTASGDGCSTDGIR